MRPYFILCVACSFLAACGDPLAKVDKLSSVDLADDVGSVGALPDASETARQGGLFTGLFNRGSRTPAPVQSQTNAAVSAALADVNAQETSLDQSVTSVAPIVSAPVAPPARRGLFGFMRSKETVQPVAAVAPIAAAPPQASVESAVAVEPEKVATITQTAPAAQKKPRRGLFGLLAGARAKDQATPAQVALALA